MAFATIVLVVFFAILMISGLRKREAQINAIIEERGGSFFDIGGYELHLYEGDTATFIMTKNGLKLQSVSPSVLTPGPG